MKNFALSFLSLLMLLSGLTVAVSAESYSPFDAMGVRDLMASARNSDKEAQHAQLTV